MLQLYKYFSALLALLALVVSVGCATSDGPDKAANEYFTQAMEYMEDRDFRLAIEQFERLNAVHPFSQYAEQSLLELAYAYYENRDRQRCRVTIGRFIRQYPDSEQLDYALFLRGLSNFDDDRNLLHNALGFNPASRSLQGAQLAYDDFSRVANEFPNSRFAAESVQYMLHIRELLAEKEILVAEFYLTRNANVAALGRAQYVLENYISTNYTPRALAILAQAYTHMGMQRQAQEAQARLKRLYPDYIPVQDGQ